MKELLKEAYLKLTEGGCNKIIIPETLHQLYGNFSITIVDGESSVNIEDGETIVVISPSFMMTELSHDTPKLLYKLSFIVIKETHSICVRLLEIPLEANTKPEFITSYNLLVDEGDYFTDNADSFDEVKYYNVLREVTKTMIDKMKK